MAATIITGPTASVTVSHVSDHNDMAFLAVAHEHTALGVGLKPAAAWQLVIALADEAGAWAWAVAPHDDGSGDLGLYHTSCSPEAALTRFDVAGLGIVLQFIGDHRCEAATGAP